MQFFIKNRQIFFMLCFLLYAPLFVCANPSETSAAEEQTEAPVKTLQETQALLEQHLQEWNAMKPALMRLIKSEQDLNVIIAALDKVSPLAAKPTKKQLIEPKLVDVEKKTEIIKAKNVGAKKSPSLSKKASVDKTTAPAGKVAMVKASNMAKAMPAAAIKQTKAMSSKTVENLVQIGVHLASYVKTKNVESGWKELQHDFAREFAGKRPLYYQVRVGDLLYTRLVVGPFASHGNAQQVCDQLTKQKQYCQVINYKVVSKK